MAGYTNPYARALMANPKYSRGYAMYQQGSSTAPVNHWAEGLARLGQGLIGGWQMSKAEKEEDEKKKERAQKIAAALQRYNAGDIAGATADLASIDDTEGQAWSLAMEGSRAKREDTRTADERAWREQQAAADRAFRERMAAQSRGPGPAPVAATNLQTGKTSFVSADEIRRNPTMYGPPNSGGFTVGPPGNGSGGGMGGNATPDGIAPQNDARGIMGDILGRQPQAAAPNAGEGFVYGPDGLPKMAGNGMGLYRSADGTIAPKPFNNDPSSDPDRFKNSNTLRDEFVQQTKIYSEARAGYEKVTAAANNPSGAGDVALIFGFMKTIDPNSTVREGEFATAQQSTGVPQQVIAMYNRALSGQRLTAEQRADFANQAKLAFGVYQNQYDQTKKYYGDLAGRFGLNPNDVLVDRAPPQPAIPPQGGTMPPVQASTTEPLPAAAPPQPAPPPQQPAMPQPGMVENGFRFKGGNPGDPNSWEPVQ